MSDLPQTPESAVPNILVIDDDEGCRTVLARALEGHGCRVATAVDGDEAIQKERDGRFDVALADLEMPRRGGLDAVGALKAIDPKIEVVIVTGNATVETAIQSMKLGAYDFVTKPFALDHILRIVDRALEKRRLSSKVDELQDLNRLKSEFLANMSHELRTPMNAILGYTSLHLDRVYGEITPKQEQSLKRVEAAGKNLLRVINNVLDHSKMAAGRMPVYLEDFSLNEVAKEVLEMMECLAQAKHLKLELKSTAGDIRLRSDKTKVKQILVNLITNAIKFTSAGGVFVEIAPFAMDSAVHIRVRDTGIGIKTEDMPLLFQQFRQLDSSSTREQGGTGLGLVISREFAQLLGGSIGVESAPGAGATFTVVLPLESVETKDSPVAILQAPASGKENRVLLAIDDDPEILNLLRDSLEGSGYGFAGALTGGEGIAMARHIKPLAITLDVMMPHRDGWAVLQILKNDPDLRDIPVIMVSLIDNKNLGFALGVADYVVKPFNRVEILEKLKTITRGGGAAKSPPLNIALDSFRGG
jgi:signal transduction histidine kinase